MKHLFQFHQSVARPRFSANWNYRPTTNDTSHLSISRIQARSSSSDETPRKEMANVGDAASILSERTMENMTIETPSALNEDDDSAMRIESQREERPQVTVIYFVAENWRDFVQNQDAKLSAKCQKFFATWVQIVAKLSTENPTRGENCGELQATLGSLENSANCPCPLCAMFVMGLERYPLQHAPYSLTNLLSFLVGAKALGAVSRAGIIPCDCILGAKAAPELPAPSRFPGIHSVNLLGRNIRCAGSGTLSHPNDPRHPNMKHLPGHGLPSSLGQQLSC
jgi:hypothetical protein